MRGYKQLAPLLVVTMLLLLPVLTGLAVGRKWPNADANLYATLSQIIATLFIAIVVEFLGRNNQAWEDRLDKAMMVGLIVMSWSGLFGCVRAMLGNGSAFTAGLAAAGMTSASILVALALFARVRPTASGPPVSFVLLFLYPPVILLVLL